MLILIRMTEAGNISEAARQLNIRAAALSRLEIHLEAVLVSRSSQGISLTNTAQVTLNRKREIIE
ncbi:LysR family transcriptional regulator [Pantoea stewartii]|uniref:helix-turn-helix domain-containing protein n=1 Tax=Pantoea stewartii TaxID=66269 RepID=UPI0023F8C4C2|nr:LysR family transcriptional regulator [Pantoea stewartii]MDF7788594.1 LysR family transcriptional regulator [Pantoea stewartii]